MPFTGVGRYHNAIGCRWKTNGATTARDDARDDA